eukprot:TRINITY_DN18546_c0_g1_i1.p1 TRINITY_DN18546_c0_g1~~TRINITY_DN18546_c0_g1_i1.p1  ORF type:complete len:417 (-),score=109.64 TRINITY_DN18546_c0_g1_i1:173-1423(-)
MDHSFGFHDTSGYSVSRDSIGYGGLNDTNDSFGFNRSSNKIGGSGGSGDSAGVENSFSRFSTGTHGTSLTNGTSGTSGNSTRMYSNSNYGNTSIASVDSEAIASRFSDLENTYGVERTAGKMNVSTSSSTSRGAYTTGNTSIDSSSGRRTFNPSSPSKKPTEGEEGKDFGATFDAFHDGSKYTGFKAGKKVAETSSANGMGIDAFHDGSKYTGYGQKTLKESANGDEETQQYGVDAFHNGSKYAGFEAGKKVGGTTSASGTGIDAFHDGSKYAGYQSQRKKAWEKSSSPSSNITAIPSIEDLRKKYSVHANESSVTETEPVVQKQEQWAQKKPIAEQKHTSKAVESMPEVELLSDREQESLAVQLCTLVMNDGEMDQVFASLIWRLIKLNVEPDVICQCVESMRGEKKQRIAMNFL